MKTNTATQAARKSYRFEQVESGLSREAFRAEVSSRADEVRSRLGAEALTPEVFVMIAAEVCRSEETKARWALANG